jgi:hypothetical protein
MTEIPEEHKWRKYIRPGSYIFSLIVFFALMFIDGNITGFAIKEIYLKILENLLLAMTAFYFTSRGLEKIIGGKNNQNSEIENDKNEDEDFENYLKKYYKKD